MIHDDESGEISSVDDHLESAADDAGFLVIPEAHSTTNEEVRNFRLRTPVIDGYEIVESIAQGGTSHVYLANSKDGEIVVAIKVFSGTVFDRENLIRFGREIESLKKLQHPNIVKLFDFGVAQNSCPYLILEYIDGTKIDTYCHEYNLDALEIARLMIPVCNAVEHANRSGVLHRDMKPSNILVDRDGIPFVTDFGLAKAKPSGELRGEAEVDGTRTGVILGTLNYLPPEQLFGLRNDGTKPSDVFGIGAVLHKLLTGRPPFAFVDFVDAAKHYFQKLPTRIDGDLTVPDSLSQICLSCLSASPGDRYETAAEVATQLNRLVEGKSVRVPRKKISGYVSDSLNRYPWIGSAMLVAATGLVFSSLFFLFQWQVVSRSLADSEKMTAAMTSALMDFSDSVRRQEDDPATIANRRNQLKMIGNHYAKLKPRLGDDPEFLFEAASSKFKLGRLEHYLGNREAETNSYQEALAEFTDLVAQFPDHENGKFGQFHAMLSLGQHEDAFKTINVLKTEFSGNMDYEDAAISVAQRIIGQKLSDSSSEAKEWLVKVDDLNSAAKEEGTLRCYRRNANLAVLRARYAIRLGRLVEAQNLTRQAVEFQELANPLRSRVDSEAEELFRILKLELSIAAARRDESGVEETFMRAKALFEKARQRYSNYMGIYWGYFLVVRNASAFFADVDSDLLGSATTEWVRLLDVWPKDALDGEDYNYASLALHSERRFGFFNRTKARKAAGYLSAERYPGFLATSYVFIGEQERAQRLKRIIGAKELPALIDTYMSIIDGTKLNLNADREQSIMSSAGSYYFLSLARATSR